MARHWIEVYPDGGRIAARLVCEHPTDCRETGAGHRAQGCSLVEWVEATSVEDLLHWPAGEHPVIGRLEVAAHWEGSGEGAELTLVPPTGVPADLTWLTETARRIDPYATAPSLEALLAGTEFADALPPTGEADDTVERVIGDA